jgi:hypothetical protein|tara:strand:+ start:1245 stop:1475 length:231 start_codon:yes stop_codon:yes gene_type:complete
MNFRVCKRCDFEWHSEDGEFCPVCKKSEVLDRKNEKCEESKSGGFFISAEKSSKTKKYLQALGLVTLVYLLIHYVL